MNQVAAFIGRLMLALIFILGGLGKLFALQATGAYMAQSGQPADLALPAGIFELVAGLAIALGFLTRIFSILLAGFCLLTGLIFHHDFTDQVQSTMLLKNIAMAGGFLCLFAHTQMRWSYDSMRRHRQTDLAAIDAERHAHEAELRAARAEGRTVVVPAGSTAIPAGTTVVDTNGDGIPDTRTKRRWF
ncbi:DoxX family protein [Novosphingobium lentum]|uniref:DoxX family protein n=1 Tax=Novosphingobium lentum TaxID=145287 RepID=UPI000AC5B9A2|nr:DoxX family protein [Novosphingobium lentum]